MTENEIYVALYNMYCATSYKNTIVVSKETVVGLWEYFNQLIKKEK